MHHDRRMQCLQLIGGLTARQPGISWGLMGRTNAARRWGNATCLTCARIRPIARMRHRHVVRMDLESLAPSSTSFSTEFNSNRLLPRNRSCQRCALQYILRQESLDILEVISV